MLWTFPSKQVGHSVSRIVPNALDKTSQFSGEVKASLTQQQLRAQSCRHNFKQWAMPCTNNILGSSAWKHIATQTSHVSSITICLPTTLSYWRLIRRRISLIVEASVAACVASTSTRPIRSSYTVWPVSTHRMEIPSCSGPLASLVSSGIRENHSALRISWRRGRRRRFDMSWIISLMMSCDR